MRLRLATLLILSTVGRASAGDVKDTSYALPSGDRVLRHEGIVRAVPMEVWKAFTTGEGLRSFAAPVADIDLRIGGLWEASYDPTRKIGDPGNIRNEVLSYLPGRMLSIRVREAPPRFPHPDIAKSVFTVILFEAAAADATRVEISMLPYKRGEGWDDIYGFFEYGNPIVLGHLQRRFESGPIDWKKELEPKK